MEATVSHDSRHGLKSEMKGLRDESKSCCDVGFRDSGIGLKTGGWAGGGRAEDVEILGHSDQEGQE